MKKTSTQTFFWMQIAKDSEHLRHGRMYGRVRLKTLSMESRHREHKMWHLWFLHQAPSPFNLIHWQYGDYSVSLNVGTASTNDANKLRNPKLQNRTEFEPFSPWKFQTAFFSSLVMYKQTNHNDCTVYRNVANCTDVSLTCKKISLCLSISGSWSIRVH